MRARIFMLAGVCLALGGCVDALVGLGIELGGRAVLAGIDAATSGDSESGIRSYCWNPGKQTASTSSTLTCTAPEYPISKDDYDKFRNTGVAPGSAGNLQASATQQQAIYCADTAKSIFYTVPVASRCVGNDEQLSESDWRTRQASASELNRPEPEPVYCWDSQLSLPYEVPAGKTCGNDSRITEQQYHLQVERAQEAEVEEAKAPQQEAIVSPKPKEPEPPIADAQPTPTIKTKQVEPVKTQTEQPPAAQLAAVIPHQLSLDAYDVIGSGTGFAVSHNGHILTNQHVVEKCDTMAAITGGGLYEAPVLDANERLDLAVLQLPFAVERFATFSAGHPEQGDAVFVVGYPLLDDFREIKITDGIVSGLSGPNHDKSLLQMTAAVQPGNSGGPLINSAGAVVGVVVGKYTGPIGQGFYAEGINFAVAPEAATAYLALNGVRAKRSTTSKELKGREIMRRAEEWTAPLLCLVKKASG